LLFDQFMVVFGLLYCELLFTGAAVRLVLLKGTVGLLHGRDQLSGNGLQLVKGRLDEEVEAVAGTSAAAHAPSLPNEVAHPLLAIFPSWGRLQVCREVHLVLAPSCPTAPLDFHPGYSDGTLVHRLLRPLCGSAGAENGLQGLRCLNQPGVRATGPRRLTIGDGAEQFGQGVGQLGDLGAGEGSVGHLASLHPSGFSAPPLVLTSPRPSLGCNLVSYSAGVHRPAL
jgi:hypothetical protein